MLAPILFKIVIIPIRVGLILTFLIFNREFFDNKVRTMKKALELMSEGTL